MSSETNNANLVDGFQNSVRANENGLVLTAAPGKNLQINTSNGGEVEINGSPVSSGVNSVFGRTGSVIAESSDYSDVTDLTLGDGTSSITFETSSSDGIDIIDGSGNEISLDGAGDISVNSTNSISLNCPNQIVLDGPTQMGGFLFPQGFAVSILPTGQEGAILYAVDGRKVGELSGAGTGVVVYFSNGEWRVFSTDAQVQS